MVSASVMLIHSMYNAYMVSTGAMHYALSRVQCLYNKHKRNAYTLSNVKCLYGKHRCDALYIKPSAMLI